MNIRSTWLLLALFCSSSFSLPLMAKDSIGDLFKRIKPPSSEWKIDKAKKGDVEVGVKGKTEAVNIGVKLQGDVPISAESFLDQVRSKIIADPSYQGPEITLVNSQMVGGASWNFFVIKRRDQINQEFWARPLSSDKILMVLYTAIGTYYEQYRGDLLQVLQQASSN